MSGRRRDLIGCVSFDELAAFEPGAGADECDEMWCVDCAPVGLRGLDELERHREAGGLGTGAPGELGAVTNRREGRLDRICGAQMYPVLGGEVVERQEFVEIVGDFGDRFAELGAVGQFECRDSAAGMLAVLSVADLGESSLGARMRRFGSADKTLPILWNQQRCVRVVGKTSRSTDQNPNAPSPTARIGARIPRRAPSRSRSAHDPVDSR